MPWGHTFKTEEFETIMRGAFCLGNTPMLVTGFLPKTLDDITPDITRKFRHYTDLYKSYIRPLMATCKVYHLAPINATGGVETGDWFAMEFVSSDCRQGWALVVRIADSGSDTYDLKLKGLNARADYAVTSDNSGSTDTIKGATLMSEGLRVKMPDGKGCSSELLLFTAR
jgi:hypothetical protein